jgi:AraC-like DNA-binding protein
MFIPLIRFQPSHVGVCLPLFTVQLPQKTISRLGFGGHAWELFLRHCMGIDITTASLLNTFIDLNTYRQVLTLGMRLYGADQLMHWYVEDTGPSHLGPVGVACASAPTVREGLEHWMRFTSVTAPAFSVSSQETQRDCILNMQLVVNMGDVHEMYQELALLLTRRKLLDLSGGRAAVKIRFAHKPLHPLGWYQDCFGVTPELDCATSAVVIERRWLDLDNDAYTPLVYRQALDDCKQLLENYRQFECIGHRVRSLLVDGSHHNRFFSLDQVAEELNLSVRTLTRRLSDEKTSFRDIQCEVRLDLAKQQLQYTRLPIKAICSNAGFTNVSAFSRAFRKYTSVTPTDFRDGR